MNRGTLIATKEFKLCVKDKNGASRVINYGNIIKAVASKAYLEAKGFICTIEEFITKGLTNEKGGNKCITKY